MINVPATYEPRSLTAVSREGRPPARRSAGLQQADHEPLIAVVRAEVLEQPPTLQGGQARRQECGKSQKCLAASRASRTAPETVVVATILVRLCVAIDSVEDI